MEEYLGTTRFLLTCNYMSKVRPALHSRCQEFDMTPPFDDVLSRCVKILKAEGVTVADEQKAKLVDLIKRTYPDIRKCINRLQKNVVNGELVIQDLNNADTFTYDILDMLKSKKSPMEIRSKIIENEMNFNNDYHLLLRSLFDQVYSDDMPFDKKRVAIMYLCEGMYRHNQVLDAEINAFSCIVQLSELLGYK
jgi:DNA polymerase III delta prime subunit